MTKETLLSLRENTIGEAENSIKLMSNDERERVYNEFVQNIKSRYINK